MFSDPKFMFNANESNASFSSCGSLSSSFSSDSSYSLATPVSTPPRKSTSPHYIKLEESIFETLSSPNGQQSYHESSQSCPTSNVTAEMMGMNMQSQSVLLQSNDMRGSWDHCMPGTGNNFPSFQPTACQSGFSNHGLYITPQPFADSFSTMSNASPVSEDFVDPLQTTFLDPFAHGTPIHARSMQFNISFDADPSSFEDFSTGSSPIDSFPPTQENYGSLSTSSTPTKASSAHRGNYRPGGDHAMPNHISSPQGAAYSRRSLRDLRTVKRVKREPKQTIVVRDISIGVHGSAKFECLQCNKFFQRREHLKRHARLHNPDKMLYPCEICNRPFDRTDNLKSHLKGHINGSKRTSKDPRAFALYKAMARKPRKSTHEDDIKMDEDDEEDYDFDEKLENPYGRDFSELTRSESVEIKEEPHWDGLR